MNEQWLERGKVLKKAREARGISLKAVHESTKIPLDALKSIEEGYRIRVLTDFYYRSFIKLYAKYLGVEFPPTESDEQIKKTPSPIKDEVKKTLWDDKKFFNFSTQQIRNIIKWVVVFSGFVFVIRISGCIIRQALLSRSKPVQEESQSVTPQKIQGALVDVDSRSQKKIAEDIKLDSHSSQKVSKNLSLVVLAKRASWLQIEADGKIVFRSTLEKGASGRWEADEKIELSGRNIRDLELEINGRLVSLGRTTRRIKGVVITRDGFEIKE